MAQMQASPERLRELLDYDHGRGVFVWRINRGARFRVGMKAGSLHSSGGRVLVIDGRCERESRVVWAWVYGQWPQLQIDHINGDETDNRIANLREVTGAVNCQNKRRAPSTSRHGFLGVSPIGNRWRAQIKIDGRKFHLGLFATPEQAQAAYFTKKREAHAGWVGTTTLGTVGGIQAWRENRAEGTP